MTSVSGITNIAKKSKIKVVFLLAMYLSGCGNNQMETLLDCFVCYPCLSAHQSKYQFSQSHGSNWCTDVVESAGWTSKWLKKTEWGALNLTCSAVPAGLVLPPSATRCLLCLLCAASALRLLVGLSDVNLVMQLDVIDLNSSRVWKPSCFNDLNPTLIFSRNQSLSLWL